ncbi:hypothetical protein [Spirulina major]|nr:hypothetical protein [Spirulina major]
MIEIKTLTNEILELSPEAQIMVAEFVHFLKAKAQQETPTVTPLNLENHDFVGMWSDRSEMQDSSQWVKNIRQDQWTR